MEQTELSDFGISRTKEPGEPETILLGDSTQKILETSPFYYTGYIGAGLKAALGHYGNGISDMTSFDRDNLERTLKAVQTLEGLLKLGTFILDK